MIPGMPPARKIIPDINSLPTSLLKPKARAATMLSSSMACPRTSRGPAQNPLLATSLMVTASKGPGIIAPERAMTNDVVNISDKVGSGTQ